MRGPREQHESPGTRRKGSPFMRHLGMNELTASPCKRQEQQTLWWCWRRKEEWRGGTITVKGLAHDSHFYVNARPGVKCRGASAKTLHWPIRRVQGGRFIQRDSIENTVTMNEGWRYQGLLHVVEILYDRFLTWLLQMSTLISQEVMMMIRRWTRRTNCRGNIDVDRFVLAALFTVIDFSCALFCSLQ